MKLTPDYYWTHVNYYTIEFLVHSSILLLTLTPDSRLRFPPSFPHLLYKFFTVRCLCIKRVQLRSFAILGCRILYSDSSIFATT